MDQGSKYYVTDLTATSSSESEPEEESDKVQVYLVHVPSSLSLFHTLSFGFVDSELSYDSPLTAGALGHTLFPTFLALLVNCTLSRVDLSLTGYFYQSTGLAATFVHLFPFPHFYSSF